MTGLVSVSKKENMVTVIGFVEGSTVFKSFLNKSDTMPLLSEIVKCIRVLTKKGLSGIVIETNIKSLYKSLQLESLDFQIPADELNRYYDILMEIQSILAPTFYKLVAKPSGLVYCNPKYFMNTSKYLKIGDL